MCATEDATASADLLDRDAEEQSNELWSDVIPSGTGGKQNSQLNRELLDDIAGGTYWRAVLDEPNISWEERCARMIEGYRQKLRRWFKLAEALPVHADTSAASKYWIVFASRYGPAFDLFNGAACKRVRRSPKTF